MSSTRIEKLCATLVESSAEGALVLKPADIFYLAGVKTEGVFVITQKWARLYVPGVSFEECKRRLNGNIECRVFDNEVPWDEISTYLKGIKTAVNPECISYKTYVEIKDKFDELIFVEDMVSRHRIVKDPREQELIRKACGITSEIFAAIDAEKWRGKTERDLSAYLEQQAWKNGGSGSAFTPVVAAGVNSVYPHHQPSGDYILGGWFKVDFGVVYDSYCSDLTRTFILDKFINNLDSEKLLLDLNGAQAEAEELLMPGIECSKVYEAARKHLEGCGLAQYFVHGLGHGVGIEIHERPYLKSGESQKLQEGMVVTVEPGFYMPGIGGMRVEDTYLIKKEGAEKLTGIYK